MVVARELENGEIKKERKITERNKDGPGGASAVNVAIGNTVPIMGYARI